ncbi:hypothetical protein P4O66_021150, partial [Electrophorus voltai]
EQCPLIITESDVRRVFKRVNTRNTAGPDGICGRVLKACADQLAPVFIDIFNISLTLDTVPSSFKQSTIVPVPKKLRASGLNDYRPVALTSVVMKCFEKLVRDFITSSLPASMDPLQFAYCRNHSTDDAIAHLLHTTLTQLDKGREPQWRVYLGVLISQDLSWSCDTNSLPKKARQHIYHLRCLRDFRLPCKVLQNFYTCAIESILMRNMTAWFGNSTKQDRQAVQRVVRSAEHNLYGTS